MTLYVPPNFRWCFISILQHLIQFGLQWNFYLSISPCIIELQYQSKTASQKLPWKLGWRNPSVGAD